MNRFTTGNIGLALALALACAMSAIAFLYAPEINPYISENLSRGIAFQGISGWGIGRGLSFGLNLVLILIIPLLMNMLNKNYNFINNTDTVIACALLVLCGSNIWLCDSLNQSMIEGIVNIFMMFVLFGCYRNKKSTAELFICATMVSITAMFCEAGILFAVAILFMGAVLGCMSFKGIMAFLLGLMAPWWILIGFGVIKLQELQWIAPVDIFHLWGEGEYDFMFWINAGVSALIFILCSLYNSVGLYAGNPKRRRMCNSIMVLGFFTIGGMVFDAGHATDYIVTLYIALAVQLANLFALHNLRYRHTSISILLILYCTMYVAMINGI